MMYPQRRQSGVQASRTTLVEWHSKFPSVFNTGIRSKILAQGIAYMVENRKKLLPFNPANGWGSYDGFVPWLIKYRVACEDNPGCIHYIINIIRPSALTNISGKRQITA